MNKPFLDYLDLLAHIGTELDRLSELARQKTNAVRHDDLNTLDQIMRQEQASTLAFRGLEQKQMTLLDATGLKGVPLSAAADRFPSELRLQAKQQIEQLQTKYKLYQSCSEVARNTLECNLHQIEKILANAAPQSKGGPGYQAQSPEIPAPMRTNFWA